MFLKKRPQKPRNKPVKNKVLKSIPPSPPTSISLGASGGAMGTSILQSLPILRQSGCWIFFWASVPFVAWPRWSRAFPTLLGWMKWFAGWFLVAWPMWNAWEYTKNIPTYSARPGQRKEIFLTVKPVTIISAIFFWWQNDTVLMVMKVVPSILLSLWQSVDG